MADRILNWYLEGLTGDGTNQGGAYCLEKSYALPAVVRIYAVRAPAGDDLVIDIKDDGESIFGTHTVSMIETSNEYSIVNYTYGTLATNTFSVGEIIDGGTSTAKAEVMAVNYGRLDVRMIKETAFTVGDVITGATNNATATVDAFTRGQTKPRWDVTESKYYAVLPNGLNSEEHAASFADDKQLMEQYSWITLDVVQSGGAKKISVQLELNHEYKEEEPDEED